MLFDLQNVLKKEDDVGPNVVEKFSEISDSVRNSWKSVVIKKTIEEK